MIRTEEADKSPNICIRMLKCLFNVAEFREVPEIIRPPGLNAFFFFFPPTFCLGNHL